FDLAVETGQLQKIREDMRTIQEINHPELRRGLLSPVISEEKKVKIFDEVFKDEISPLSKSFFELIFRKGREIAFPQIVTSFEELYRESEGIVILHLTTSMSISDELKEDLLKRFQSRPGLIEKKLVLEHKVDENIIGGFVAQTGDLL